MAGRDLGRTRQREIFAAGLRGRRPRVPLDPAALERAALRRMGRRAAAYIGGGAGLEETLRANRAAFARWRIAPRMLRDISELDAGVELLGHALPAPIVLAPVGALELAHPEADVAVARAAGRAGLPLVLSSQASRPMEACAAALGEGPRWFQLYWSACDELVESFLARAEACSCSALVVTLDTQIFGWRTRDLELGYSPALRGRGIAQYTSDPVFRRLVREALEAPAELPPLGLRARIELARAYPGRLLANLRALEPRVAVQLARTLLWRPSLSWGDLEWLRRRTRLPIVLKGILRPDDARRAVEQGVAAIVVSNHGGRQLDAAVAALDALPAVADAVAGRVPLLVDGGVRTGSDVLKALALGARAACIGRPYVYGLALAGEEGVAEVLANLMADFEVSMGLAGCASVGEIDRDLLVPAP